MGEGGHSGAEQRLRGRTEAVRSQPLGPVVGTVPQMGFVKGTGPWAAACPGARADQHREIKTEETEMLNPHPPKRDSPGQPWGARSGCYGMCLGNGLLPPSTILFVPQTWHPITDSQSHDDMGALRSARGHRLHLLYSPPPPGSTDPQSGVAPDCRSERSGEGGECPCGSFPAFP